MQTQQKRKRRLWSKRKLRVAKPVKGSADKGISLRLISEADQRFAVVKEMKRRLEQLMDDAGLTSVQQEWLAARAVFMVARIESMEVEAMEGKAIKWGTYVQAVNCLSGLLGKIGVDKSLRKDISTLEQYVAEKEAPLRQSKRKKKP